MRLPPAAACSARRAPRTPPRAPSARTLRVRAATHERGTTVAPLPFFAPPPRRRSSVDVGRNLIHGSDSPDSAAKEVALWCVGRWGGDDVAHALISRSCRGRALLTACPLTLFLPPIVRFPEGVAAWKSASAEWVYE